MNEKIAEEEKEEGTKHHQKKSDLGGKELSTDLETFSFPTESHVFL
jgi:hypothetical protein